MKDPKVFISYSWTSQSHQELVKNWADRLLADGVDVILDIYDLREGDDKYAFMEKMVTDPSISHVLVICDKEYAEKANNRKAGVGTESQIISGEIYEKVTQSKFIPIICEFDNDGEPILPVFMKTRMWINFSSLEAENNNWEQLIRLLFGKPQHIKPEKGKVPSYISSDAPPVPTSEAFAKFNSLKQAILQNKRGLKHYRNDFIRACIDYSDKLRVRKQPMSSSIGEKILEDCGKLKAIRNHLCDWVLLESEFTEENQFSEALIDVFEKLRDQKVRPPEITTWNDNWFEAHSVFVYESFLYIVAALLKTGAYEVLNKIYTTHYLLPIQDRHENLNFRKFDCFFGFSRVLQDVLAPKGHRLHSPTAELIKRQADRDDISFSEILQADLLTLLLAFITPDTDWFPQTLYYATYGTTYPFFIRASQHKNFKNLATITGIESADELRKKVKDGHHRLGTKTWHTFHFERTFWSSMNMDALDTLK